jgi:hypothetical protein
MNPTGWLPTAQGIHKGISTLLGLARFGRGLRAFLRRPITVEEARRTILARHDRRADAFLTLVARAVFAHARSPYRALFRAAGCELGDVEALVRREGLDEALARLCAAGVSVSFDEFKGRQPARRGGQTFRFAEHDFDNPLVRPSLMFASGGSRGTPTRLHIDLDYLADRAALWCLWFAEHGLLGAPLVFATPYHPGSVNLQLICARFGSRFVRWFAIARDGSLAYRIAAAYLNGLVSRIGRLPRPEFVSPDGFLQVGQYLQQLVESGRVPCVNAAPSTAIRLSRTLPGDRPLRGVTFLLGYEPLTAARRTAIEASGARAVMTYGSSEAGTIGQQCGTPVQPDDVHVASDAVAVIRGGDQRSGEAGPLLVTSLLPTAPKILINASIGDVGVLDTRPCGCGFDQLGYVQHLHGIRSPDKMTGEGVTVLGSDVTGVLEDVLPLKFGGDPTDYQLVEEEGSGGLVRYRLIVSPRVGVLDESAVTDTFLAELARRRPPYRFMVEQWVQAGMLTVVRTPPVVTARGKLLAFRTLHIR